DLQGGASVVLAPVPGSRPSKETLEQAISIIRQRVDGVGVGESDISRQGSNVVIQLPGVKDTDRLLALVGQTAQLRFRAVLGSQPVPPPGAPEAEPPPPLTPREEDKPEAQVTLPGKQGEAAVYQLGPALADGTIVKTARAEAPQTGGEWKVSFELTDKGSGVFDGIASKCSPNPDPEACPSGSLAIVLDGVVQSAPSINTANFGGKGEITGKFSEREAKDLALVLRYGSLPVEFVKERSEAVSASLGKESLQAGLVAGAVGLGLVLLYMVLYYRALGVVVLIGLCVSGALLYSIITYLSKSSGLALSLAGATGVIVSVGVTVDSYIVYFERLKDDLRSGRSVKASVGRSFNRAWRTILVADGTSFIGAVILWWLTVGPVRGFALTLALSTALDVVIAWFFTRPMVAILGRSRFFTEARFFGLNRSLSGRRSPVPEVAA
ncbi:MAG: protein translocase subunit SecD, partial [Acidimicrobiales bacterium]